MNYNMTCFLEDGVNDIAVIHASFATPALFPDDSSLHSELLAMIPDARGNLARRLQEIRDGIQTQPDAFDVDYERFRIIALDLMVRGVPARVLNRMMKVAVFDGNEDSIYRLDDLDPMEQETVNEMPAHRFVAALFDHMLQSVKNDAHFDAATVFDAQVFRKYIAIAFVYFATINPRLNH